MRARLSAIPSVDGLREFFATSVRRGLCRGDATCRRGGEVTQSDGNGSVRRRVFTTTTTTTIAAAAAAVAVATTTTDYDDEL